MKCETLSSHLPSVPSFAVYSRRYDVIYSGNPFSAYGLKTSSQVPRLAFQGVADTVCVSRDERNVAISSSALIKLYDVDSGREIRNLAGHSLPVHAICPRRNSIYNWFSGSLDSSWIMWDIRCHPAKVLDGRASGPIRCLDISPDDSILAVGTDSSLQLFDIRNRQILNRFGYSSNEVSFNPAEKLLASVGVDRIVRFICMDQMECVSVSDPLYGEIRGISFAGSSPDTDFLVACTDLELRILTWEPCDTLSSCQLPTGHHVLNVSLGDDSVDLISYNTDGALSLVSYSVEEVLTGEIVSLDQSSPIPSTPSPPSSEPEEPAMAPVLIARPPVQEKSETRISTAVRKPHRAATTTERLSAKEKVTTRPRSPSANCIPPIDPNNKRPKTPEESTLKNSRSNSNSRHSLAGNRAPSPAVKLSSEKKPLSRKASPSEEKPKQSVSIDVWVSKFETKGKKAMKDSKLRIQNIRQAESAIRRFGLEEAAAKEVIFYDSFILKTVLSHYNSHHLWDIGLVHRYLPRIKDLLDDSSCTVSCLESLEYICDGLLDKLVKNAQYFSAIGVDVTAEERRERSEECLKTFRQIRDSRNSYYKKLSEENYLRLDNIIAKFKKL